MSGYDNRHEFLEYLLRMSRNTEKQERQCTYKVTLRRVVATIVAVEEQRVLYMVCVCVFKIFLAVLRKNTQISNFTKIRPVGAELFHKDRQTDGRKDGHDEANSYISHF